MDQGIEDKGLSTEEALIKLKQDIEQVLNQFYASQRNR